MKATIVGVIALVVGLGIGIGFSMNKADAIKSQLDAAQADIAEMEVRAKTAEDELEKREAELGRLRDELDAARAAAAAEPEPAKTEAASSGPDAVDFFAQLAEALGEVEESGPEERRGRFGDRFEGGRRRGEDEDDDAPREERRRAYMDEFRQRMDDFLMTEIESSNDPAEKQRIASIGEYMQSLMDQRRLIREAQTEEERRAVFDTMRENAEVLRSMVEEQQDEVMRDSLERQGITSRSEQDDIIQAYKEAQDDPFFGGPFTFFGGRGYGMRGRGGPPGGGGGTR